VSSRLCPYGGQEKLKNKGGGFDFIFLAGFTLLEGKSLLLLQFLCCLVVYLKLC
jgi:hypothetical protein